MHDGPCAYTVKTLLARTGSRMWALVLSFAALPEGRHKGKKHTEVCSWGIHWDTTMKQDSWDGWVTTSRNCFVVSQLSTKSATCRAFKREEKAIAAHCQVRLSVFCFLLEIWIVHQSWRQIVGEPAKPYTRKGCLKHRRAGTKLRPNFSLYWWTTSHSTVLVCWCMLKLHEFHSILRYS